MMNPAHGRMWCFVAVVILLRFGPICLASTTNVTVESFDFSPPAVSININDSVKWTWTGAFHSTTSSSQVWDSGIQSPPATFTFAFTSAGDFPYFCTAHTFMTASVTVVGPNQPPSVAITNPANGAVFAAPWTGTLHADATDGDGSVTNVQFFNGLVSLGQVASPPFDLGVTNLAAGTYTLKAVASDNAGATNASAIVTATVVNPISIVLTNPVRLSDTQFKFTHTANPGLSYAVDRGTTLSDFAGIFTNLATGSSISFTDVVAGGSQSLYRVRRLPNPE